MQDNVKYDGIVLNFIKQSKWSMNKSKKQKIHIYIKHNIDEFNKVQEYKIHGDDPYYIIYPHTKPLDTKWHNLLQSIKGLRSYGSCILCKTHHDIKETLTNICQTTSYKYWYFEYRNSLFNNKIYHKKDDELINLIKHIQTINKDKKVARSKNEKLSTLCYKIYLLRSKDMNTLSFNYYPIKSLHNPSKPKPTKVCYQHVLLCNLGEIYLKGNNRHIFIMNIMQTIQKKLKNQYTNHGKLCLFGLHILLDISSCTINDQQQIIEIIQKIIGIKSIYKCIYFNHNQTNINDIYNIINNQYKTSIYKAINIEFKGYHSKTIKEKLSTIFINLQQQYNHLSNKTKDSTFYCISNNKEYIAISYQPIINGIDGQAICSGLYQQMVILPILYHDKNLHHIILAAIELMKRGTSIIFIYFYHDQQLDQLDKVKQVISLLNQYQRTSSLYIIPYHFINSFITTYNSSKIDIKWISLHIQILITFIVGLKHKCKLVCLSHYIENIQMIYNANILQLLQHIMPIIIPLVTMKQIDIIQKIQFYNQHLYNLIVDEPDQYDDDDYQSYTVDYDDDDVKNVMKYFKKIFDVRIMRQIVNQATIYKIDQYNVLHLIQQNDINQYKTLLTEKVLTIEQQQNELDQNVQHQQQEEEKDDDDENQNLKAEMSMLTNDDFDDFHLIEAYYIKFLKEEETLEEGQDDEHLSIPVKAAENYSFINFKIHKLVQAAMLPYWIEHYGNTHSPHSLGQHNATLLQRARSIIASSLSIKHNTSIYFTSNINESKKIIYHQFNSNEILYLNQYITDINDNIQVRLVNLLQHQTQIKLISLSYVILDQSYIYPIQDISDICQRYNLQLHVDLSYSFCKLHST